MKRTIDRSKSRDDNLTMIYNDLLSVYRKYLIKEVEEDDVHDAFVWFAGKYDKGELLYYNSNYIKQKIKLTIYLKRVGKEKNVELIDDLDIDENDDRFMINNINAEEDEMKYDSAVQYIIDKINSSRTSEKIKLNLLVALTKIEKYGNAPAESKELLKRILNKK